MNCNFIAIFFIGLIVCGTSHASTERVDLRIELCRNVDRRQLETLAPKWIFWLQWPNIVQLCPLYSQDWRLVWQVLTLRWDRMSEAGVPLMQLNLEPENPDPKIPSDSIILLPDGRSVGVLPDAFPGGSPGIDHMVATDWHDGFPYRVETYVYGAAWRGDYTARPLVWNRALQSYEAGKR